MFLWNDEEMSLCGWVYVREDHAKIVFVKDLGRDLFVDDFAKDAILHVFILFL